MLDKIKKNGNGDGNRLFIKNLNRETFTREEWGEYLKIGRADK